MAGCCEVNFRRRGRRLRVGQSVANRFTILSVVMEFSHQAIDLRNERQDRLLANRLRGDTRLVRLAKANLRRWKARDGKRPRPIFVEWQRILDRLSAREIADFLVSDTPMARRLRQSTPFLGLYPKSYRRSRRK